MPHTLPRPAAPPGAAPNLMERQLLETLGRIGPAPLANVPVRWPLIRMHAPVVIDRLLTAGLVRRLPSAAVGGVVDLTARGRQLLRENGAATRD